VEGGRPITVHFTANTTDTMPWSFKPQQSAVKVVPGETALAFYTAYNPTNRPVTGVSTYNVSPARVGLYFNKIQCFCFEEQRLRPGEEIDMPVRRRAQVEGGL
jgi:cytochrome c oxidase assembly protein subunit 11